MEFLQKILDPILNPYSVDLYVLRLDLMHLPIGGNKYYKLKYNLEEAKRLKYNVLLTFGGAFSNHIYATAIAGKIYNFKTIGIIRGEETLPLNPTLTFAQQCGMELHYFDRTTYRQKNESETLDNLRLKFGDFYWIPEGGTNHWAIKGASEIIPDIPIDFDYICTPCGTGGTLAGLVAGSQAKHKVLGISVLKGNFLKAEVGYLLLEYQKNQGVILQNLDYQILTEYHFGGYAKKTLELIHFMERFEKVNQIKLEWIYSGKMFYAIYDLIQKGYFIENQTIIALHTGGLR